VVGAPPEGYLLNAIRSRPVSPGDVRSALARASAGPVAEGSVGAGTGTVAFGWKGGVGTSSRRTDTASTAWTVGVLVQSNFGGDLQILGVPVGRALSRTGVKSREDSQGSRGSIMMVVATDAPLSDRNLRRLAARAMMGLGKTGSSASNGSGDYVIAFSTHPGVRRDPRRSRDSVPELANEATSGLFQATVEATEEAVYNSLFAATTISSSRGTVEALPVEDVVRILRTYRTIP
jgi:D-aminopeptidase